MDHSAIATLSVTRIENSSASSVSDLVSVEEPMEIRLVCGDNGHRIIKPVSVTMRTPGQDAELAAGFLFTEGIITVHSDIASVGHLAHDGNITEVRLQPHLSPSLVKLDRNFYTTSSCGVCGKSSIEAVRTVSHRQAEEKSWQVSPSLLYELPGKQRKKQDVFDSTGGLHAAALFDLNGELVILREDVGRHNALDKLIGAALEKNLPPLDEHILLLSGRASFELIQKAAMAGIRMVAAVGAPSSLAVALAKEFGMTLAGFLKPGRFNVYCGEKRIILE